MPMIGLEFSTSRCEGQIKGLLLERCPAGALLSISGPCPQRPITVKLRISEHDEKVRVRITDGSTPSWYVGCGCGGFYVHFSYTLTPKSLVPHS